MSRYTNESLMSLRQKIDLVDVLSSHIQLKRAGGSYKALCPFHEERSPSFVVQKGDSHYHCFGCGAHGDAIQFLMQHLRMSFADAVSHLAERFSVALEETEVKEEPGVSKARIKGALSSACRFYRYYLLESEEGSEYLQYLFKRGLSLPFIHAFDIGLAPKEEGLLRAYLHAERFSDEELLEAGLLVERGGRKREFFSERIMFPIHDAVGSCIGFSARKIREAVFGGKYINTQETALFKKSRILFGLNYSRKRIAKERHAVIVEGQLDALRLIYHGFDYTIASLGTAFGDAHVRELEKLQVTRVYLLFDSDRAGQEAALKTGHLFQKVGIEVMVASLPAGMDPDLLLAQEGPAAITRSLIGSKEYLPFLIHALSKSYNMQSPAEKQKVVDEIRKRIQEWANPVMVHESLKKAARILNLPEDLVALEGPKITTSSKHEPPRLLKSIDPNRILEADLIRWMVLGREAVPDMAILAEANLSEEDFKEPISRKLYGEFLLCLKEGRPIDIIEAASRAQADDFSDFVSLVLHKKVKKEKARELFLETVQKILERNWMLEREEIKVKIHSGMASEKEVLELAKKFDALKKNPPKVHE